MHVMHKCPNMTPEAAGYVKNHGWDREEIPLNIDTNRAGQPNHIACPYCGQSTKDMQVLPEEDKVLLNVNLRSRSAQQGARPEAAAKHDLSVVVGEMRAMREELAKYRAAQSSTANQKNANSTGGSK